MAKLPSMQFYPGDWRKDPGVQALSYEDRGIWFEILLLMFESGQRGKLVLNGKKMPDEALAQMLGLDNQKCKDRLTKLIDYGVAKVEEGTGIIYCSRMVKDEEIRITRKKAGEMGGNPVLLNQNPTTMDKQKSTPSSSSSSSSSLKPKNIMSGKPDQVGEVLDYLNQKSGRSFHDTPKHRSLIKARFKEGYSLDDFKRVVDNMVLAWGNDGEMAQYIRPPTLFSGKFDSYLNKPPPKEKTSTFEAKRSVADKWLERSLENDQTGISHGSENISELRRAKPG